MARFLQPSLSRGEITPGLRGRTDLAAYMVGLAKCRNMVTKPTGGAVKRPGTRFCGRTKYDNLYTRLIPFVYSTEVFYLVEAGDQYFRFWVDGALLTDATVSITGITQTNPAVVTSVGHGLANGSHVLIEGVAGMDRINGRTYTITVLDVDTFSLTGANTTGYDAYTGGGTASRVVEVGTPYTAAMLPDVRFTQSADVLFLTHGLAPINELQRLSPTVFQITPFDFRRGPFRPFNSDEAAIMAVSGTQGAVTVTTNVPTFTTGMVGQLIYLEEKELRSIKPWASAWKNPAVGTLARSDQKVYRVSAVTGGGDYYITGATRPTHSVGRAWDGPGDVRSDGVDDYGVGVEWEFLYNTFGIVKITEYVSATSVKAVVVERVPDSLVGTAPSPVATWTNDGDGTTKVFPVAGATSDNPLDYTVTINGIPVQSNPFYPGGGGVGGGGGGAPGPREGNGNLFSMIQ